MLNFMRYRKEMKDKSIEEIQEELNRLKDSRDGIQKELHPIRAKIYEIQAGRMSIKDVTEEELSKMESSIKTMKVTVGKLEIVGAILARKTKKSQK